MYAIVRRIALPTTLDEAALRDINEFGGIHHKQPGFIGTIEVDEQDGRTVVINLWESQEAAEAGRRIMCPLADQKLAPRSLEPPELIAVGDAHTTLDIMRPRNPPGG